MSDGDALLAAILAEPDEDTPRLAYADWLDEYGGEAEHVRAEFIRTQIALSCIPPREDRPVGLVSCEKRLLTTHRNAWLAPLQEEGEPLRGGDAHGEFRRGFVEVVWMPASWFILRALSGYFRALPVRDSASREPHSKNSRRARSQPVFWKIEHARPVQPVLGRRNGEGAGSQGGFAHHSPASRVRTDRYGRALARRRGLQRAHHATGRDI